VLGLAVALCIPAATSRAADVIEAPSQVPVVAKVIESTPNIVSFQLTNQSTHPVRDVEVLVAHVFRWENEFAPGQENPSRAATYEVPVSLSPHETTRVTYALAPPLALREDGHFDVEVEVLRWTAVLPPS
jgi:hypothetical protein